MTRGTAALILLTLAGGCKDSGVSPRDGGAGSSDAGLDTPSEPSELAQRLRDPETCKTCHPTQYREWSASMHAYAARDPVFIAMNKRGQRETEGALGDFCVKCHAPMAVYDGLTQDGLNLEELPDADRGVSCYFCHNVVDIDGSHNGKLRLAGDETMRGPIADPFPSGAHRAEYSDLFDESSERSSAMCGACHDVVTPAGVHLERTSKEYLNGIFSKNPGEPPAFDTCVGCHMSPEDGLAAVNPPGAPRRTIGQHLFPGVDVALTDFPHREAMRSAVEDCELGRSVSYFTLEVTPPNLFTFQIETGAGHNQPSGAAQDRRMWLEFLAYDAAGNLIESASSGNIADGEIEEYPADHPKHDPQLVMFRDYIYDAQSKPAHMFWDAVKSREHPDGYESHVLPVSQHTYAEGRNAVIKQLRATTPDGQLPARITARLRMRPIGQDVLQDLVASGDLDPKIAAEMPTFTFGAKIEWTLADGLMKPIAAKIESDCDKYRCLLDPNATNCAASQARGP